jgi:hypothetical protein
VQMCSDYGQKPSVVTLLPKQVECFELTFWLFRPQVVYNAPMTQVKQFQATNQDYICTPSRWAPDEMLARCLQQQY